MSPSRTKSDLPDLRSVYSELVQSFEKEHWDDLLETLERISEVGEKNGRREISIQAQSLRSSIENSSSPGHQFDGMVLSLKQHLSHLVWMKESIGM